MNRELKLVSDSVIVSFLYISRSCKRSGTLFKSLLFWLAGEVSWLAVDCRSTLSMSKIKVRISETKYRSFYKTLVHTLGFSTNLAFLYVSERDLGNWVDSNKLGCAF